MNLEDRIANLEKEVRSDGCFSALVLWPLLFFTAAAFWFVFFESKGFSRFIAGWKNIPGWEKPAVEGENK